MTERESIIKRLQAVSLGGGSHEGLSNIARAVYEPSGGWTIGACGVLRQRLIQLIGGNNIEEFSRGYRIGFDEGFSSACAEQEDEMVKHGWYRALDADENPIRISDAVEHNGVRTNVLGITFHGTTPPTVCITRGDCWVEADELYHVKQPTVEDVLYDSLKHFGAVDERTPEVDSWVCEQAAKLREMLAGDAG